MYSLLTIDNGFERTVEILDNEDNNNEAFGLACEHLADYIAPTISSFMDFKRYPLFYKKYDFVDLWYFSQSLEFENYDQFSQEKINDTIALIRSIDKKIDRKKFFINRYNFIIDKNNIGRI